MLKARLELRLEAEEVEIVGEEGMVVVVVVVDAVAISALEAPLEQEQESESEANKVAADEKIEVGTVGAAMKVVLEMALEMRPEVADVKDKVEERMRVRVKVKLKGKKKEAQAQTRTEVETETGTRTEAEAAAAAGAEAAGAEAGAEAVVLPMTLRTLDQMLMMRTTLSIYTPPERPPARIHLPLIRHHIMTPDQTHQIHLGLKVVHTLNLNPPVVDRMLVDTPVEVPPSMLQWRSYEDYALTFKGFEQTSVLLLHLLLLLLHFITKRPRAIVHLPGRIGESVFEGTLTGAGLRGTTFRLVLLLAALFFR